MTAFGTGPNGLQVDPENAAVEALADLAATLRGGGRVGAEPLQLAADFGDNLARLAAKEELLLTVEPAGLNLRGRPFWSQDMLSRRVVTALRAQGLASVTIAGDATPRALEALAVLLARDWSNAELGALRSKVASAPSPGLSFGFEQDAPGADQSQLAPADLLAALRSGSGPSSGTLSGDAGRALAEVRRFLDAPADVAAAIQGAGLGQRERMEPELEAIAQSRDVDAERLGRMVFEVMRLDPSGLQAADTFRLALDHFDALVARGRPEEADGLLRRALALADGSAGPDLPHGDMLKSEVGALLAEDAMRRLVLAADAAGDGKQDAWRRLLLGVGRALTDTQVERVAPLLGELQRAAHRQAVADGIVLIHGADLDLFERWLRRVPGPGQSIILLALGRLNAPTLLQKILARVDSPLPVVRRDALVALRKHRSPRTQDVVRRALSDEDGDVRVEALRYVSVYRDTQAAQVVIERLRTLPQGAADADELRAMGLTVALIVREDAVPALGQVIQLAAESRPDAAVAAVHGLHALGSAGAEELRTQARQRPELRAIIRRLGVSL